MAARPPFHRFARYAALAYELPGTILAAALVGWLLDRWLGTEPFAMLICTVLAFVGGLARIVIVLKRFERLDREAER